MEEILDKLLNAVEFGKVDKKSPFPPQLIGQDGSHELTIWAIENGIKPKQILENALIPAMERVGKKFSEIKFLYRKCLCRLKQWELQCSS